MADNFAGSKFLGEATVKGTLFDLGDYPGLLLDTSGQTVFGEVYEVDTETLKELDEFEATADYRRFQTTVSVMETSINCWVYCPDPERCEGLPRINSGDWIEYSRSRKLLP